MHFKHLIYRVDDGIAYVTLNRPDKHNAINYELFCEIDNVQKLIKKDRSLRVVIINANGKNFSAGIDIKSIMGKPSQFAKIGFKCLPWGKNMAQRFCIGWQSLPIPVIAVVQGVCYGAGMSLALGADWRYVAPNAELAIMEAKWGMVPDMAGLDTLRGIVTKDIALELIHTAEPISAQQALDYGLVTRVCQDPMADAQAMAEKIKAKSPDATAAIKLSTHRSWNAPTWALLTRETVYQIGVIVGKNWRITDIRNRKDPKQPFAPRQRWW